MKKKLFRESALEKFHSLDKLDSLVTLTNIYDWAALLTLALVIIGLLFWLFFGSISIEVAGKGILVNEGGLLRVVSPAEGFLTNVSNMKVGDMVSKGQIIANVQPSLNPDQQKNSFAKIISPFAANVEEITAQEGNFVHANSTILHLIDNSKKLRALVFLPTTTNITKIKVGLPVKISLESGFTLNSYTLEGRIQSVSQFPSSKSGLLNLLHEEDLAKFFLGNSPPYLVVVSLLPDKSTISGYKWSSPAGKSLQIKSGALISAFIITEQRAPIDTIL